MRISGTVGEDIPVAVTSHEIPDVALVLLVVVVTAILVAVDPWLGFEIASPEVMIANVGIRILMAAD